MNRDVLKDLMAWKDDPSRKPLVLMGARQVGKTWILKHFGETAFENVAYVNCDNEPLAKSLFESDYNIDRILLTIQAITGTKVEAGRTLVIFDELQEARRGLHSLKYFCENAPEYHVATYQSTRRPPKAFSSGRFWIRFHPNLRRKTKSSYTMSSERARVRQLTNWRYNGSSMPESSIRCGA